MLRSKIGVIISTAVALIATLCCLVVCVVYAENQSLLGFVVVVSIAFSSVFLSTNYIINRSVHAQLYKLYKLLYDSGLENSGEEMNMQNAEKMIERWRNEKAPVIQRLKKQEEYRKEFVGNISHELKTPIFNIQGYILTLLDGVDDKKVSRKYLKRVGKNIDRMVSLVEDLDMIAKLEHGKIVMEKERFNLLDLIEDAVEDVEMQAFEEGVEVEVHSSCVAAFVNADKDGIFKVICNLLANSIKYGRRGGKTDITVSLEEDQYQVEIKDDGIGIAEGDIGRIFERFYRVDKSRSRNIGGSGLGLSIVKHIIEAHNTEINVESEPGKGTSFLFSLDKNAKNYHND